MKIFEEIQSQTIAFEENPLLWRFEDEDDCVPYEDHKNQIQPLSNKGATLLDNFISECGIHDDFPFQKNRFRSIERLDLDPVSDQDEFKRVDKKTKKWLYGRADK